MGDSSVMGANHIRRYPDAFHRAALTSVELSCVALEGADPSRAIIRRPTGPAEPCRPERRVGLPGLVCTVAGIWQPVQPHSQKRGQLSLAPPSFRLSSFGAGDRKSVV